MDKESYSWLRFTAPSWQWSALFLLCWLLTALLTRVGLPDLHQKQMVPPGPLENLGAIATAVTLAVAVEALEASLPWLEWISPRSHVGLRAGRMLWCLGYGAVGFLVSALFITERVSTWLWVVLICALVSAELVVLMLCGRIVASLTPVLMVVLCSLPSVLPWEWSLLNEEVLSTIGPWVVALAPSAATVWIWRGTHQPAP